MTVLTVKKIRCDHITQNENNIEKKTEKDLEKFSSYGFTDTQIKILMI